MLLSIENGCIRIIARMFCFSEFPFTLRQAILFQLLVFHFKPIDQKIVLKHLEIPVLVGKFKRLFDYPLTYK